MTPVGKTLNIETASESGGLAMSEPEVAHVARLVTIGELSACFAHEVFNPLMMIRGHVRFAGELVGQGDPLQSHLEVIERASRRIEELARRMLEFSRKQKMEIDRCGIGDVLQEALCFVRPYLHSKNVIADITVHPGMPQVAIDRSMMIQAFVNLMQNAADAMVGARRRILSITARWEADEVRIAFADTGKGIPSSDLDYIFAPFFTTKGERGTGLGLYITRKIVEDHQGSISVQTSERGSTFVLSLPLE